MNVFQKLDDYLAPPPLAALIAVLMVLGINYLGKRLTRRFSGEGPRPIHLAAAFLLVTATIAAAVNLLILCGMAYGSLLRTMAWALAALGILEVVTTCSRFSVYYRKIKAIFNQQTFWGKTALVFVGITLTGYFLTVLAPAADADSLHYHLGVPLDMLRHHGFTPRMDWYHMRLIGLGESLNMLGLAGGTDVFGALLQFAGLILCLIAVNDMAKTDLDKILFSVIILSCPALINIVSTQKPMMLPIAATTVSMILIAEGFQSITPLTILISFVCIFFSMSCKYSFYFSGLIILALGMFAAYRAKILKIAIVIALTGYFIYLFPVQLHKYIIYGDPISPFLEKYRGNPDITVIRFASHLKGFLFSTAGPFPLNLFIPFSFADITTVLGVGPFLLLLGIKGLKENMSARVLIIGGTLVVVFMVLLSQVTSRFFLEPYFWAIPTVGLAAWGRAKKLFFKILLGQLVIITTILAYGVVTLFPGALTANLRNKVMEKYAIGYAMGQWLGKVLPQDAVVIAAMSTAPSLLPRPFVDNDIFSFYDLKNPGELRRVLSILKSFRVNTVVINLPLDEKMKNLKPYLENCLAGPKEFTRVARNPFQSGGSEPVAVYKINLSGLNLGKEENQVHP